MRNLSNLRFLRVAATALSISAVGVAMGACARDAAGNVIPITDPQVQAIVTQVQNGAVAACGYEPTAETILGILAKFVPGSAAYIDAATAITSGICSAVTTKSLRRGSAGPRYRGVLIRGRFVR